MIPGIVNAIYNKLIANSDILDLLGDGVNSITSAAEFTGDTSVPAIVLDHIGSRKTLEPHFLEDWAVYVLDRDYGYSRISAITEKVFRTLDHETLDVSDNVACFDIEWMSDVPAGISRTFRAETGGAIYRLYLST